MLLFAIILVVVISIYMLLDMPRLEASIDRRFPPHQGLPLTQRIERALWGYVKGQVILSTVIGLSAGVGMWILGTTGLVEGAERYALLFGVWTALVEVVPYIGPWLSAVPPAIYALAVDPVGFIWVALLFIFIYQVEGHIVVPNVMANALRLHPLLVIFGLLAGAELYGIPGVLVALPTMAASRAIWEFFRERVELEPWDGDEARRDRGRPRAAATVRELDRTLPGVTLGSAVSFPSTRLRRLRRTEALRSLVRETRLSLDDLVAPLFACPGEGVVQRGRGLAGIAQRSVDTLVVEAAALAALGVRVGDPVRDPGGEGRGRHRSLARGRHRAARAAGAPLGASRADVDHRRLPVRVHEPRALRRAPRRRGRERRDDRPARAHRRRATSRPGADVVAPSDMMDGRVAAIRAALPETPIVSYAAKYASAFYGPFREVAESAPSEGDRRGYQMDPANVREALRECQLDLDEGADALIVKPALPYLDVIRAVARALRLPRLGLQRLG